MSTDKFCPGKNPKPARLTGNLCLAVSMAVIGSTFQFGYNTGVINSPKPIIVEFYNQTFLTRFGYAANEATIEFIWSFTVAIFAVGGMLGSLLASKVSQHYGLKRSMLLNNVLAVMAGLLMGFCKLAGSFEMLIIGRFVIGINSGINMVIAPMYLTEIAPVQYRGSFGTLSQFGVVTSLLLSQVLGLEWLLGTARWWPLLLGLTIIFAFYQIAILPFCPDSPRHLLLVQNNVKKAEQGLLWFRGANYDVELELNKMNEEVSKDRDIKHKSICEVLQMRRPLIIAVVMQLSQQLSGINAVFYYSSDIFIDVGILPPYTAVANVSIGVINVIMTSVSIVLVEKAGRRLLHMVGLGGMLASSITLAVLLNLSGSVVAWMTIIVILIFVVFFQSGPGAIPWFITAEIFDQQSRPSAVSIAGMVNWFGNFAVAIAYPTLASTIGGYTFVIFAVLLAGFLLFTYVMVPETKGRDITDIVKFLSVHKMQYSKSTKL